MPTFMKKYIKNTTTLFFIFNLPVSLKVIFRGKKYEKSAPARFLNKTLFQTLQSPT
jgi:hypothetical protein